VAKEEETSARTRCLARLKDLIAVGARVQRLGDLFEVDIVHGTHALEYTRGKGCDLGAWQSDSTFIAARLPQCSRALDAVMARVYAGVRELTTRPSCSPKEEHVAELLGKALDLFERARALSLLFRFFLLLHVGADIIV